MLFRELKEIRALICRLVRVCEFLENENGFTDLYREQIKLSKILKIDISLFIMNISFLQNSPQKGVDLIHFLIGEEKCTVESIAYAKQQKAVAFDPPLSLIISVRHTKQFFGIGVDISECILEIFASLGSFLMKSEKNVACESFIRRYLLILRYYVEHSSL